MNLEQKIPNKYCYNTDCDDDRCRCYDKEYDEEFEEQAKEALMDIGLEEDEAEREVEDFY